MSSIDERTVKMQFDNATFKKEAANTQKSLADLNKAVDSTGKAKGLLDLSAQMGSVSVAASKMAVVTTTALATIANKATNVAINLASALTFDPIKQGFFEYEELLTKQNVIMNATGKTAAEVKGFLNQLNRYSDQTIYSFSNMTASITKFVNAGIPLPQAVKSIKGIANAAAFAGATTEEANRAMYAFSQSMSTGFLMLNDWMQIENANMATMGFKEQLLEAGVAAGTLTKKGKEYITVTGKSVSATKGWREGLQEQWATTEVMNTALAKYTDLSTKLGREASESATEVRSFTAFMDTLKESLGSGWSAIFTSLFGNLAQSTRTWTALSGAVGGAVEKFFHFTSTMLKTWRKMGGFEKTLQGFKNLLAPIGALLGAIGDAWAEAFPSSDKNAGKALYGLSAAFEAVTRPLTWLADLIRGTTPLLTTFFKAFRIGGEIIGSIGGRIVTFIQDLLGLAKLKAPSSGGFLGFIKDLGRAIANAVDQIDDLLQKGASLSQAFGSVDIDIPSMPSMPSLPKIGGIFGGGGEEQAGIASMSSGVKNLTSDVLGLKDASAKTAKEGLFDGEDVMNVLRAIGDFLGNLKDKIADFLSGISSDDLVSSFNMAVFATMGITIIRFIRTITKSFEGFMGIGEAFNSVIDNAGSALKSFQTQARAKLILNIAIALLLLAGALFILSRIPADDLAKALLAMGAAFLMLDKGMKSFSKLIATMNNNGVQASINAIALSIAVVALAGAMILFATACLIMNKVEWQSIAKGLGSMVVMAKTLEVLGNMSAHAWKNLLGAAVAITAVSVAMLLMAGALLAFKMVDWGSMAKAGVTLAALTLAIGLLALIPYAGIAKVGLALLAASGGMVAMAAALIIFGKVEWESIGKAAVVLGMLTLALLALMVVGNPVSIGSIISLAFAVGILSVAMIALNDVEWASIAKISVLMLALVVAFAAFAGVIYLAAPVVPLIALLAGALFLLGLGLLAFSAALAIAMGLAAGGVAAFAALATGAAVAIAVFMQTLAKEAPVMSQAFLDILETLIDTIVEAVPMVIDGIKRLWAAVVAEFSSDDKKGKMKNTGKDWIEKLGDGLKDKMPYLMDLGADLLVKFLHGLERNMPRIVEAGVGVIVSFINGVSKNSGRITTAAVNMIIKFAEDIQDQVGRMVTAGVMLVAEFLHELADLIRNGSAAIASGVSDVKSAMEEVGNDMAQGMIDGFMDRLPDATQNVASFMGTLIKVSKDKIQSNSPSKVFMNIGKFMVQGLTLGIQNNAAAAISATAAMITGQIALATDMVNGFIQRLDQRSLAARAKAEGLARAARKAQEAANKTKKDKSDDKAANVISRQAKKADKEADRAEQRAKQERAAEARKRQWENADALGKAKIRAADAKRQIDAAKAAERDAEAARVEANALDKMSKAKGLTEQQRKAMRKEADRLRKEAREEAAKANKLLENAKDSAAEAMKWQQKAGEEAAKAFQDQYEAEAKADADAEAFDKLTAEEKAKQRREEAQALQAQADENLRQAKILAYTDIEAANDLAELALEQAERARDLIDEAEGFEAQGGSGQVLNLDPTAAAADMFNKYAELYDAAYAAAATTPTVEVTQNNYSPEALDATTIYRQTNNLVTFAAEKLTTPPAVPAA